MHERYNQKDTEDKLEAIRKLELYRANCLR